MTDYSHLERLRDAGTAGEWTKFYSRYGGDIVAIMKGKSPGYDDRGLHKRRWKEIVAWTGFDGADTTKPQRHRNAELIVAAVNAVKPMLADLRAKDARIEALVARIAKLEAGLRPFASDRLSSEPTVSDLVLRAPHEQLRIQAGQIEQRDAEIKRARTLLLKDTDNVD